MSATHRRLFSIAELKTYFLETGRRLAPLAGGTRVISQVDGMPALCEIVWSSDDNAVCFVVGSGIGEVPDAQRGAVAAEIARLNGDSTTTTLGMRNGHVYSRLVAFLDHEGAISSAVVDRCVAEVFRSDRSHSPRIRALLAP